jgi:hypothetical protein
MIFYKRKRHLEPGPDLWQRRFPAATEDLHALLLALTNATWPLFQFHPIHHASRVPPYPSSTSVYNLPLSLLPKACFPLTSIPLTIPESAF